MTFPHAAIAIWLTPENNVGAVDANRQHEATPKRRTNAEQSRNVDVLTHVCMHAGRMRIASTQRQRTQNVARRLDFLPSRYVDALRQHRQHGA